MSLVNQGCRKRLLPWNQIHKIARAHVFDDAADISKEIKLLHATASGRLLAGCVDRPNRRARRGGRLRSICRRIHIAGDLQALGSSFGADDASHVVVDHLYARGQPGFGGIHVSTVPVVRAERQTIYAAELCQSSGATYRGGGICRVVTLMRFQALMTAIAMTRDARAFSS